uniref:ATP synthase F0 subunit 8 n=1 Tax=Silvatares holzenthali TaxID=3026466 RepID=UPI0023D8C9ED|nr:ATP synthase F0 subunit 8 [Silvatares holzenthali]WCR50259.1 ATP synthase F0 subunit 8 [Silvatares holzenthali]
MPQMMPMSWFILYLFFISLFIIFIIMNYYIYQPQIFSSPKLSNKILESKFNFKKW